MNKPWAVLAAAPALIVAGETRVRLAAVAGLIAGAWFGVWLALSPHGLTQALRGAGEVGAARPEDLWWPLDQLGTRQADNPLWSLMAGRGPTTAYFPPQWLAQHAHQLMLVLAALVSLPVARRRERSTEAGLALLAVLFLMRCLLDPANFIYYEVPFVFALVAWEAVMGRRPVLALAYSVALWTIFKRASSLDAQYVGYLAITLPPLGWLGGRIVRRPLPARAELSGADAIPAG